MGSLSHHVWSSSTLLSGKIAGCVIPNETSKSKKLIHIGLYGYKRNELTLFDSYKNNKLEKIEKLEQLRFIENRRNILVLITEKKTIGIDTKNDFEDAIKYYFKKKSKSSFDRNSQK